MAKIYNEVELELLSLGFKERNGRWQYSDGAWFYYVDFEGYAYVLYKTINIYRKPFKPLFWLFNSFTKKNRSAQINLYYDVPICHFREPKQIRDVMKVVSLHHNP